ncbi:hypothetical protein AYL99_11004 [Fonsecaea erecta]|uniref:Uncharacterized protein n=1 Tax=Fonsecaea erecta TaxID=1367422 RepID=A0A178Z514_9EURO|nr:hypothetical protein AYL99_11004 [Fonsecaea erecta]OAP54556.1 hypothetical protein AYL99_11004 [Fonsecaea erecta]
MRFLCCGDDSDTGPTQPNRPHVDFDANAEAEDGSKPGVSRLPARDSFKLLFEGELPPDYTFNAEPDGVRLLLDVIKRGHRLGHNMGISGAFNALRHRHISVWVDDNHRLPAVTRNSMRSLAVMFLSLAKAVSADMEFFFMSQSNTESGDLTPEEKDKAKALDRLWITKNWSQAKTMVEKDPILQDMGLLQWMENNSSGEVATSSDMEQAMWPQRVKSGPSSKTNAASTQATNEETPRERFLRLLSHVRDLKLPFWQGYYQDDIDMTALAAAHASALEESGKQPKSLNSLRFTFEREIGRYLRLKQSKGHDAAPTTVLLLTGSPLQPTEADAIIKCQKDNTLLGKQPPSTATAVRGEGSQFCIQTIAWTEFMDEQSKRCLRKIDNANKGEDDINDLTEVHDTKLRDHGASAELLFKVLNSHNPAVDGLTLKDEDKYGKAKLYVTGQPLVMPGVDKIAAVLGQNSEDVAVEEEISRVGGVLVSSSSK